MTKSVTEFGIVALLSVRQFQNKYVSMWVRCMKKSRATVGWGKKNSRETVHSRLFSVNNEIFEIL